MFHLITSIDQKKDQEEGAPIRQVLIEQKAQHLEAVVPQNLGLDPNHHLGVSDGPSQNRLKARASLEEMLIVTMKIMFIGQLSVRFYTRKYP